MNRGTIWKLVEPFDTRYAQCGLRSPARVTSNPCAHCTIGQTYELPMPLVFEWEVGSDTIGDFAWPGLGRVAVTQRVLSVLAEVSSVEGGDIDMIQDPKLKRPKNPRRAKPRVWLPYTGPELRELIVPHHTHTLPETTFDIVKRCAICGRERRNLVGVEVKQHKWSTEIEDLVPIRTPRAPGQGLFVSGADVRKAGLFRVHELPVPILCTDAIKAKLEEAKLTNLDFLEYGEAL